MDVSLQEVHEGGRVRQKARTRDALVAATRQLLRDGVTPTVEQAADVVDVLGRIAPLVEDPRPRERLDAAGDDPEGLACGVVVDGPDQPPV